MSRKGKIKIFSIIGIIAVILTGIIVAIIMIPKIKCENAKEEIAQQIERNIEEAKKDGDFSDYLDIEDVKFDVTEVFKHNGNYYVRIKLEGTTDKYLTETELELASWDMQHLVREDFQTDLGEISPYGMGSEITSIINGEVIHQDKKELYSGVTFWPALIILLPLALLLIGWPYFKEKIEKAQLEEEIKRKAEMEALRATMTDSEWYQYLSKILGTHLSAPNHADGVKCPNCGEYNAERLSTHNSIGQVALNNIGKSYKCHSCGHSW